MDSRRPSRASSARCATLAVAVLLLLAGCRVLPGGLLAPEPVATPLTSPPASATMCRSRADLRADVEFLRSLEVSEDGLRGLVVAADSALAEARTLAGLVVDEYQPYVTDVVASLQDLRDVARRLESADTIGAGIASVGEAITQVGLAMEGLELALRDPCAGEPGSEG